MGIYQLTDRIIDPTRYPWGHLAPLWTPANITTALWLDASDSGTITLVSDAVSEWADKSGNARHATQGTSGNRPSLSSSPSRVAFNAANHQFLNVSMQDNSPAYSVFSVLNITSQPPPAAASTGLYHFSAQQFSTAYPWTDGVIYDGFATTERKAVGNPGAGKLSSRHILAVESSSGYWRHYINASEEFSADNNTVGMLGSCTIGRSVTITDSPVYYHLNGAICEFLITPDVLSATDRQKLEGYLAHKWGLEANLPSDHPYKTFAPRV